MGEVVHYKLKDGTILDITIDSDLMKHSGYLGYEAIFSDNNERGFAAAMCVFT